MKALNTKYNHTTETHNTIAASYIVPYIIEIINPKSVVDIGCGLGTWLKVFKEHNITDILGIDWPQIDKELLCISDTEFIGADLEKEISIGRKFDLALCLEVLEHLDEKSAVQIVDTISSLSDTIIFSAAIPFQGGDNHINEQWPEYWFKKFEENGFFIYDPFRELFWQNDNIEWWYRQNIFLISKNEFVLPKTSNPKIYIHPKLYENKCNALQNFYEGKASVSFGFKFFIKTILFNLGLRR
jgi:SAM-dependent methyltransferase